MKRFLTIIICMIFLMGLAACSNNTTEDKSHSSISDTDATQKNEVKTAVVYFSATGNTKAVAELIADEAKADLFEIIPDQEYSDEDLDYNNSNCRANLEMDDETARPPIKNDLSAITGYDEIYLGYPIWWGTCPRIIQTLLEEYDISGIKIYAFCTSGGSGIESSISDLQTFYPDLNFVAEKRLDNPTNEDIQNWLESIK